MEDAKEKQALTAREKGDIYWRKLKYYLRDARAKEKENESRWAGRNLARELFKADGEKTLARIRAGELFLRGSEFKKRPPTATGDEAYRDGILLVIKSEEYFREILAEYQGKSMDPVDEFMIKQLGKLLVVTKNVLRTWFLSNGVDPDTGENAKSARVQKALESLDEEISLYESTVAGFRKGVARRVMRKLLQELPEQAQEKEERKEDELDMLIRDNPEGYRLHKMKISRALRELRALQEKEAELKKEIPVLEELVQKKGPFTRISSIMTLGDALWEYKDYIDYQFVTAVWAKYGCERMIRGLLTGEMSDPMAANYVKAKWDVDIPTYPLLVRISSLPGYQPVEGEACDEEIPLNDLSDMREAFQRLEEYKDTHFGQFQYQTISTILFGVQGLASCSALAKKLRDRVSSAVESGEFSQNTLEEKRELANFWLTAETMYRVAGMVLDYHNRCADRNMSDMVKIFPKDSYDMNYAVQEGICKRNLDAFMMKRNLK